ncbi:hypothetical protein V8C86DRAFT_2648140 [Haematococcus lacustris]
MAVQWRGCCMCTFWVQTMAGGPCWPPPARAPWPYGLCTRPGSTSRRWPWPCSRWRKQPALACWRNQSSSWCTAPVPSASMVTRLSTPGPPSL